MQAAGYTVLRVRNFFEVSVVRKSAAITHA